MFTIIKVYFFEFSFLVFFQISIYFFFQIYNPNIVLDIFLFSFFNILMISGPYFTCTLCVGIFSVAWLFLEKPFRFFSHTKTQNEWMFLFIIQQSRCIYRQKKYNRQNMFHRGHTHTKLGKFQQKFFFLVTNPDFLHFLTRKYCNLNGFFCFVWITCFQYWSSSLLFDFLIKKKVFIKRNWLGIHRSHNTNTNTGHS